MPQALTAPKRPPFYSYLHALAAIGGEKSTEVLLEEHSSWISGCWFRNIPPSTCWAVIASDVAIKAHVYDDGLSFIGRGAR
jgi:hypothetical protein